jgi:hypothetical protein
MQLPARIGFCLLLVAGAARAEQRTVNFDTDPGWEGKNNRIVPKEYPTIVQDFGYSPTHFAGSSAGEMGGEVQRASAPAFYADAIDPKTLDDPLSASGKFALTHSTGGGGLFFGFFRASQPGAGGRPIASLGMNIDGENSGGRIAVRLITGQNQSCGTFITPYLPGKFRPTPIRNDGTRYAWTLDYDPQGAAGRGRFTFTLHGDAPTPEQIEKPDLPADSLAEARRRFPRTTSFQVDLPDGYKQQHTTFDHFGLMNMMKPGGKITIHFDDLAYDGRKQDFSQDPHWDASGNRASYQARDVGAAHNFGFSKTAHAGGKAGEIGGTFWRTDRWGYYADKTQPLSLNDRLEAHGKVLMTVGGPDADMCFGWFGNAGEVSPNHAGDFLGIKVGGPTRVGHYFLPVFTASEQVRGRAEKGPVILPGKQYEWSIIYDPAAAGGNGAITATLGDQSVTHHLKPGQKSADKDFRLDHFGMFSIGPGGQMVKIFIDDLSYTAGPS